jgi:hypothetical protein
MPLASSTIPDTADVGTNYLIPVDVKTQADRVAAH